MITDGTSEAFVPLDPLLYADSPTELILHVMGKCLFRPKTSAAHRFLGAAHRKTVKIGFLWFLMKRKCGTSIMECGTAYLGRK